MIPNFVHIKYVQNSLWNWKVWRTDGQTDRQTDSALIGEAYIKQYSKAGYMGVVCSVSVVHLYVVYVH